MIQIPTLEEFARLESKIDKLTQMLEKLSATGAAQQGGNGFGLISRDALMRELGMSKSTVLAREREGVLTPIANGRKIFYDRNDVVAMMGISHYKTEIINHKLTRMSA